SERIGSRGTSPAASAASRVIRRIALAYGRRASIRCSARRSRAAATISIARVIFWMFLTAPMRLRTSRWEVAMTCQTEPGSGGAAVLLRAALVERVALLVEVVAEVLGEALDRLVD